MPLSFAAAMAFLYSPLVYTHAREYDNRTCLDNS